MAINALAFFPGSPRLVAALDGRGLWYLDLETVVPAAVLTGVPAGPTNQTGATLVVGGMDVANYRYSVDAGAYSDTTGVASAILLTGLSEGVHTVRVVGIDSVGNAQPEDSATMATWTVDTTPPTATVSGAPTGTTDQTGASLVVGGTDVVAYRFSVDAGPYSAGIPATRPITLTDLSDGVHTVRVLGTDAAGNEQPEASATVATWTVEAAVPAPAGGGGGGGGCFLSSLGD